MQVSLQVRTCEVQGCGREHCASGLCDMHYRRLKRHGHLQQTRPSDWGTKEKHALYPTWHTMKKACLLPMDPSWKDFWSFAGDVGDRPTPRHWLRRKDITLGFGPNNFHWVETSPDPVGAEYQKKYRMTNPEKSKNSYLRKNYGITLEDYNRMHEEQKGVCKICERPEPTKYYNLAVDHCHKTGKIRGLLCSPCNRALGFLQESSEIVLKAHQYLEQNK